jgi:hypothetical protein
MNGCSEVISLAYREIEREACRVKYYAGKRFEDITSEI